MSARNGLPPGSQAAANAPARGACLCGAAAFTVAPPYRWFAHCHCTLCRKQYGTLFATSLGVAERGFRRLAPARNVGRYRASEAFERPFCRECGAKLPARSHAAGVWHVPAGLLDGDVGAQPRAHIFAAAQSPLAPLTDSLPQHAAYPPGVELPALALPARATIPPCSGSCACGAVAFAATAAPRGLVHCHCLACRRSRGAAFASTLPVAASAFRWLRGQKRLRSWHSPALHGHRTDFCADCGSLAPTVLPEAGVALLPAGALDTAAAPLPAVHVHVAAKAPWHEITDAWPQLADWPPPARLLELWPAAS